MTNWSSVVAICGCQRALNGTPTVHCCNRICESVGDGGSDEHVNGKVGVDAGAFLPSNSGCPRSHQSWNW